MRIEITVRTLFNAPRNMDIQRQWNVAHLYRMRSRVIRDAQIIGKANRFDIWHNRSIYK